MGLDITAYKRLTPAPDAPVDGDGFPVDYDKYFRADEGTIQFTEDNWPGRSAGITPGIYAFAEAFEFRAGSYGGYGAFRRALSEMALHQPPEDIWEDSAPKGPFVELINFADNEGIIGPVVAGKLAQDFAEHESNIFAQTHDDYFRAKYRDWRKAFQFAADGGAVDFH
jgi:hypothetical protein